MTYDELESRLAAWAVTQPSIRAIITVGSRARGTHDLWSDLDVLVFTTDRDRFAADPSWLNKFGEVWLTYLDHTGPGDPEWFALYGGGLKFDAVLLHVADASLGLDALLPLYPYQGVFARGGKVLFDRLGAPRLILPKALAAQTPPTAAEFAHVINGFLIETVTTVKFVGRGDFWRAQHWFAHDLRPRLLTLIEWHALGRDTWYDGRFLEQWADSRVLAAQSRMFVPSDRDSLFDGIRAMLGLLRELGQEAAARFGYPYPLAAHDNVAALVESVLSGRLFPG